MGCGRSQHCSPSLQPDGLHKEKADTKDKRGSKKQKQAEKHAVKAISKRETDTAQSSPWKTTTNGKSGEVKSDWKGGGVANRKEGGTNREWQLEEAVETPHDTVLAVYKSSVPASARASLNAVPNKNSSNNTFSSNGSLHNGASRKPPAGTQDIEMQMEIPDKMPSKEKISSGNTKPVHITSSQLEFFKMLDEKIEKGADYNSDD